MTTLRPILAGLLTVLVTVSALSDEFEDDYWDEPMAFPNCSSGQRYVSPGSSGYCENCPAGTYNDEFRIAECVNCGYGYSTTVNGSSECNQQCTYPYTTFTTGASDSSECIHPDSRTESSFQMTIYVDIEVSGDLCTGGTAYALYGASNLMLMDGQLTRCSYEEGWSWMRFQATFPQTWGLQVYRVLLMIEDWLPLINDYADLGSYYAEKIFKYANRAMLNDLSMNLNDTVLNLDDAEVRRFNVTYREHCSDDYYVYYDSDDNGICVTQSEFYDLTSFNRRTWYYKWAIFYEVYSNMMEGDEPRNCNDNAFKQGVRTIFDNTNVYNTFTQSLTCLDLDQPKCKLNFWDCVTVSEGGENITRAVMIVHSTTDIYSTLTGLSINETVSGMEDMWYNFTYDPSKSFGSSITDCGYAGSKMFNISSDLSSGNYSCDSCPDGYYYDDNLMCRHCPFHTYSPDSGSQCNSCPFNSTTPYWGMNGSDSCILTNSYEENYVYFDVAGENSFDLNIQPTIDLCPLVQSKAKVNTKCRELYPMGTAETPTSVQEYVCMVETYSSYIIEAVCGMNFTISWDEIWQDIMNGADAEDVAMNIVCYAGMGFVKMERSYDSSSGDCPSDDVRYLSMNISLHNMTVNNEESQFVYPLFTALENLETMNFTDFSSLMYGVMKRFGMDDWSAIMEGLDMADEMLSMVGSMPGMMKMKRFKFTGNYGFGDGSGHDLFYCDNGNGRRDCPSWMDGEDAYRLCAMANYGDVNGTSDECNNCNVTFYSIYGTPYSPQACWVVGSCQTSISNGYIDYSVPEYNKYRNYFKCDDGYRFDRSDSTYTSSYSECKNYLDCGKGNISPWTIICVENSCSYPDLENGYVSYTVNDTSCPYAVYKCNSGYAMYGSSVMYCNGTSEDMEAFLPTCTDTCSLSSTISNADLVWSYIDNDDDKVAVYQCSSGYYPYYVEAGCRYQESGNSITAYVGVKDDCEKMDCSLPSTYYNAELSEQYYMNYETFGEYTCPSGYVQEGYGYSECKNNATSSCTIRCDSVGCDYSAYGVPNGYVYLEQNGAKWYKCNDGYEIYGDDRANCTDGVITYPVCKYSDGGILDEDCNMPDYIYGGYKYWDSETTTDVFDFDSSEMRFAKYACFEGMALVSNYDLMLGDGMTLLEAYGTAVCIKNTSIAYMPFCRPVEEAGHCGLPDYIDGGKAYNFTVSSDNPVAPMYANYTCYDGYTLMNSAVGSDMGWCRSDYSREVPYCVSDYDWFTMVFHLNNMGMTKYGSNTGRVSVQKVTYTGAEGWVTGCDDNMNDYGAGAICRTLGYKSGKRIEAPGRMDTLNYDFEWTNVNCEYNDTVITSMSCNADTYGKGRLCQPSEQIVVTCFDIEWKTEISVYASKRKVFCHFEATKEDEEMNLRNVDLNVRFFRWDSDGTNYSEMSNSDMKYRRKKGYKIKYSGDTPDCYSCSVYANDNFVGEAFNTAACKRSYSW